MKAALSRMQHRTRRLNRVLRGSPSTPRLFEWLFISVLGTVGILAIYGAATVSLEPIQQSMLALATMAIFFFANRSPQRRITMFLIVLSATVSLRYIVWRVTETLEFNTLVQGFLGTGLALAELYAIVVLALGYVQTIWPLERKPVPLPADIRRWPTVDIYIPTYNEELSVVRATVLAALCVDWPPDKLRVYILDDGRRQEFRDFAIACGAGYIIRPDNAHAKAGNLNHALRQTDGEFIAVFDCDHVPTRAFLQMTMGWLVRESRLAFIQTPHHFYSPDPFQRNLAAGTRVPAEGNMFYGLVQDGNDFWNAAFFCGSCAVIRRKALEDIGGFAVETVTEDAHTALRMHRKGWDSAYLRLPLAAGLATERLILHIGQRMRWARGMLQILRMDNPLFGPGLSLGQRLCYLNAMSHFLFSVPRVVFLTAPLAYLLFNQSIIAASPLAIIAYALPHLFHSVATNARIAKNWRHSFWSEIYETTLALFLVPMTAVTLINPRRGRFNVTEKGGILNNGYFDIRAVYPNLALAAVLLVGVLRGLFGLAFEHPDRLALQALLLNTIWATFSLLILMAALAVGRETRQVRSRARIRANMPIVVWLPDGRAVQGTSHNLSLGGAAVMVDQPEGIPDNAEIDIEFDTGGERIVVPARMQRWESRFLQVGWRLRDVTDEMRMVQVVFGRADAWADWDNFDDDKPMASMGRVLVSIRGLFRRPGRQLARNDTAVAAAVTPPAVQARLPRQTLVMPPSTASLRRTAAAILLLLGLSGQAVAQVPGHTGPTSGNPPGDGSVAPPPPPPGAPSMEFPVGPRPFVLPAAPTTAQPTVSSPSGASPSGVRRVVWTMRDLGAEGPMTLRGDSAIQGILFGIRSDEVVTDATLTVSGAMSPSLVPELSNITVTLNEQYVGTIPVDRDHPDFGPIEMRPNMVFFQDRNRLNFRFTGRYTRDCNDPMSGLLWSVISDASTLSLTLARLPARRDLARLPLPFFDRNLRQRLVLPFILPANTNDETVKAGAIIASWLGHLADFRGVSFPVANQPPTDGNAILVVSGRDVPVGVTLPAINGPTIAEVPNPNDPLGTILVIAGRTAAETVDAATVLTLGSQTLRGDNMTVQTPSVAPRQPYDAPAWISTDRPVRFGELVDASALQGVGYVPGTFHVPFHTSPDLYTWRRRPFVADINFRAPPGPILDVAASRLDVGINGVFLRSYSLAPADRPYDWLLRLFGMEGTARHGSTYVPPYMVFGDNDLQLFFDARPMHRGDCVAIPQDIHMGVDPDSTIDLSRAYHFTSLPNLAFFTSSGFPFTKMADLSDTAVILPDRPTNVELSAFLDLMGHIGSRTFYPVIRLTLVRPSNVASVKDKHLLLLGTLPRLAGAAELLNESPYRMSADRLSVALPSPLADIWRVFGDTVADERRRAATTLATPLGEGAAAMIGSRSPLDSNRSLVALLASSPQGLEAMVGAMSNPKLTSDIRGDLALLSGGQITSFRAGSVYTMGYLPFWLWPERLLRDEPELILGLTVIASAAIGMALLRILRWRRGRRVFRTRQTT